MTGVAKRLAAGLDVRLETRVEHLERLADGGWRLSGPDGSLIDADNVVLTAPVPQIQELLGVSNHTLTPSAESALAAIEYDPCLAVLVVCGEPSLIEAPGARRWDEGPVEWIADNQQKGVSPVPAVTIHLSPAASAAHLESPDDAVGVALDAVGHMLRSPRETQVQRWRYSRPRVAHPDPVVALDEEHTLLAAGDAFGGPRVEGAYLSGLAAAQVISGS